MSSQRLLSLDLLRGLIMVVMALDHVSALVGKTHSAEFWTGPWTQYSSTAEFLTRFVTHLCAPGFCLLMGAGMALYADSRARAGWTDAAIRRAMAKRGLAILVVGPFLEAAFLIAQATTRASHIRPGENVPIPNDGSTPYLPLVVMFSLGASMLTGSAFVRSRNWVWWFLGIGGLAATTLLIPPPDQAALRASLVWRVLLVPGLSNHVVVVYPLIPWFALVAFGVLFGRAIAVNRERTLRLAPWIGLALLIAAIAIRAAGLPGNQRLPRDESWIEFLNLIKYPPSLVFSLMTIGLNLLILGALERLGGAVRIFLVYGQSALAYYGAHLYLFAVIGAIFFRDGAPLPIVYLVWVAGLIPLYYFCRGYRSFKESKPAESLWRLF